MTNYARFAGWVLVLVLGVIGAAGDARAQIVNVQGLIGPDVPEGVSGSLDAGIDWRTGNVKLLIVTGAGTLRYRSGKNLVFGIVRGTYGEAADTQILGNTFEHVRYRRTLTDRVTLEAFAQHEFDEFRRIELRGLFGAGGRFTIVSDKKTTLVAGVAYMFEREELDERMDPMVDDSEATYNNHRASTYVIAGVHVNDKVVFSESVYFQPRLDAFDDFRLLSETGLQVKLTDKVGFKTSFVIAHDSGPPDLVADTDTSLQSAVSLKF